MSSLPKIPAWVPQVVSVRAAELNAELQREEIQPLHRKRSHGILVRLLSHPDMERVWRELRRHPARTFVDRAKVHRSAAARLRSKGYEIHASAHEFDADELERLDGSTKTTAKFLHDAALAKIFTSAHEDAADPPPLLHAGTLDAAAEEFAKLKRSLLKVAGRLTTLGFVDDVRKLKEVAEFCEGRAESFRRKPSEIHPSIRGDSRFLKRRSRRSHNELKAEEEDHLAYFVRSVATEMKSHFGRVLYGTVATLANVAFDRVDVTARRIKRIETGR
jgi:hypothetical protein